MSKHRLPRVLPVGVGQGIVAVRPHTHAVEMDCLPASPILKGTSQVWGEEEAVRLLMQDGDCVRERQTIHPSVISAPQTVPKNYALAQKNTL